jgi:hypothetical protein
MLGVLRCPKCGWYEVDASVVVRADVGLDRFQTEALVDGALVVFDRGQGELVVEEGTLTCSVCDWSMDYPVRLRSD